jgi:hypothetical protein
MTRLINWIIGTLAAVVFVGILASMATGQPRPVQLWTLWQTDEQGVPVKALLRFTSLDGCIGASYRHGLVIGETAICLPYRIGDFR